MARPQGVNLKMTAIVQAKEIISGADQIVAEIGGTPRTRGELTGYFNAVADRQNWKLPVDATVDLTFEGLAMTREAITSQKGHVRYRVKAAGYYEAVGS